MVVLGEPEGWVKICCELHLAWGPYIYTPVLKIYNVKHHDQFIGACRPHFNCVECDERWMILHVYLCSLISEPQQQWHNLAVRFLLVLSRLWLQMGSILWSILGMLNSSSTYFQPKAGGAATTSENSPVQFGHEEGGSSFKPEQRHGVLPQDLLEPTADSICKVTISCSFLCQYSSMEEKMLYLNDPLAHTLYVSSWELVKCLSIKPGLF